jgi:HD-like signal output (HDOD) protein
MALKGKFQEIKNIVAALSFADSIEATPAEYFDPQEFWLHSMLVGTAAKGISQHLGFEFGSEAFVAGLLHDLGILVIHKFFSAEFIQIIEKASSENITILEAEAEVLGLTHQDIGRFLAEKWDLPLILCESINYHHNPSEANENKYFVSIIHLVDYMTQRLGVAQFYWDKDITIDNKILELLNFSSEEALDNFIAEYDEMFRVTAESLKI